MRIALAGDHHGVQLKATLETWLTGRGHAVTDLGSNDPAAIVDYPPLCAAAGRLVAEGMADLAIILGGSGQGEVVAANKIRGVRAGLAYSRFAVEISRGNNNANVMVIGTKVVPPEEALELVELWLATPFKGAEHQRRIEQISALEAPPER